MTTLVDIFNLALVDCAADLILAPDENSEQARILNAAWPIVRDATLRAHPWNFAIARKTVAAASDVTPVHGFEVSYLLPTEPYCLRALTVDGETADEDGTWRVEGRYLVTNAPTSIDLRYIMRVVEASQFDPAFASAAALHLSARCCYRLTRNAGHAKELQKQFAAWLAHARSLDGQEMGPEARAEGSLVRSRF